MSTAPTPELYFVGWDVGGWNCDKNDRSRDAIVILDSVLDPVGQSWRGNLRVDINEAASTDEWIERLFRLCHASPSRGSATVTLAIDTPLGFPQELVMLAMRQGSVQQIGNSASNPYLFRETERHLVSRKLRPLSAIKDMIGSQATKGMHVLARFVPQIESCGVWTDGSGLRAIETYPTACRNTTVIQSLWKGEMPAKPTDIDDAHTCALMAFLFATRRNVLEGPGPGIPFNEGWIWYPRTETEEGAD